MDRRNEVAFTETQPEPSDTESSDDPNLKLLREKAKRADESESALAAARRENAMLRSGIDLESPLGEFFVKSYDGDPTDIDALKAKATELGVPFKGAVVDPVEPAETEEPTGTDQRRTLSDGAIPDAAEDEHPDKTAKDTYDRLMSEGAPQDQAAGEYLAIRARAAMAGDKRVIAE